MMRISGWKLALALSLGLLTVAAGAAGAAETPAQKPFADADHVTYSLAHGAIVPKAAGDVALLAELGEKYDFTVDGVSLLIEDGVTVSSTAVRGLLADGDVAGAAELLGRPYRIAGMVVTGAKRGRTIGFPTANLADVPTVLPGNGVYAVRARVGGIEYPAAANVGPNPTFGEDARKVEVHLIDFAGDLYGKPMAVEFVARLRDTRPFAGVNELIEQLKADVERAKGVLSK